jgi:hypothetical protein
MENYKQRGKNDLFPEQVNIWIRGNVVPEWLSDLAKVKFIDGEGNKYLEMSEFSNGGYDIKDSGGVGSLVKASSRDSIICIGGGKIFSLTPKQFSLIYKPE